MSHLAAPSLAETQPLGTQQPTEPDPPGGQDGQVALGWPAPAPAPGWPAPEPQPEPEPERQPAEPARKRKHRVRRFLARILKLALAMVVITELAAVSFIWFTPPRTAFMLQNGGPIAYQYVSLNHISRYVIAAAVAHEDQQLGTRVGAFSFDEFRDRAVAYLEGKDDPSGSTVPQQLVKNIFLWPEPNALRKGMEAGLATEFSFTLTPQRIMELYLNYAQFGPKLYGICAASWYYFNEPPWHMSEYQAAQLMGVLPLPTLVTRAAEGGIYLGPGVHPRCGTTSTVQPTCGSPGRSRGSADGRQPSQPSVSATQRPTTRPSGEPQTRTAAVRIRTVCWTCCGSRALLWTATETLRR